MGVCLDLLAEEGVGGGVSVVVEVVGQRCVALLILRWAQVEVQVPGAYDAVSATGIAVAPSGGAAGQQ